MKRNQESTKHPAFTLSSHIRNGKNVQNCIISVLVGLSSIACGRLVSKFDANTSALAPIGPKCAKGADGKCADAPRDENVTAATATPTVSASPTTSPTTSPSPTATATPSPSPTVTATASPSPTASPKPTASPTATATASPTPTPTASPTATATATPKPTATPESEHD